MSEFELAEMRKKWDRMGTWHRPRDHDACRDDIYKLIAEIDRLRAVEEIVQPVIVALVLGDRIYALDQRVVGLLRRWSDQHPTDQRLTQAASKVAGNDHAQIAR